MSGQNVEFMGVKFHGTHSNHYAIKVYHTRDDVHCK
jgi:hypothetical protein